jgi:hypothetical protein
MSEGHSTKTPPKPHQNSMGNTPENIGERL